MGAILFPGAYPGGGRCRYILLHHFPIVLRLTEPFGLYKNHSIVRSNLLSLHAC